MAEPLEPVLAQVGPVLAAAAALAGVTPALVDPAGAPLWPDDGAPVLPQVAGGAPCLAVVAAHGRVANGRRRTHRCCAGCPASDCRVVALVPVEGAEPGGRPAGALALAWQAEEEPGPARAEALITVAGGLAAMISARMAAVAARREADRQQARFAALANSLLEPVLVLDREGVVIEANPAADALLTPQVGRLHGRPAAELVPELARTRWSGQARQVAARIAGDGPPVQATVTPLTFAGKPEGALLVLRAQSRGPAPAAGTPAARLYTLDDIKGVSPAIAAVKEMAGRAALTDATILIRGESGTGKEVFAQAVHAASRRRHGPFLAVNCAAIPDSLLESELFGYDEGAFTGARKGGKPGKFELAEGGTLFLDEIGDMPLVLQAKLLRILQERMIERIGSSQVRPVNVRIIAATNRDLASLIQSGQFREDLYYRLNVIPLEIPPLRQRKEDLYLLIDHFLKKYGRLLGKEGRRLSAEVMGVLHAYPWPGNVRELENTIQYVVSLEQGSIITMASLPPHLRQWWAEHRHGGWRQVAAAAAPPATDPPAPTPAAAPPAPAAATTPTAAAPPPRRPARLPVDPEHLAWLLARHGHSTAGKRAAARELGVSLATLYRWLQRLGNENSHAEN